jgi:hypothetical protein
MEFQAETIKQYDRTLLQLSVTVTGASWRCSMGTLVSERIEWRGSLAMTAINRLTATTRGK